MTRPLPEYLPLDKAARLAGVKRNILHERIENGSIKAITADGETLVPVIAVKPKVPKEELPEYKKYKHLHGVGIGISQAARKYDVHQSTISRWVKQGLITKIGVDPERLNRVLIDEQDTAYCVGVYKSREGQGRWIFNHDGTPYLPKALIA